MRPARRVAGAAFAAVVVAASTGFVRLGTDARGPSFAWSSPTVSFLVQKDGTVDVPDPSAATAVRLAFRSWSRGPVALSLVEDPLGDPARRDFGSQDVHLVLWDEDGSTGLFPDGSGILALTPVVADSVTGRILDADVVLNGREFSFATDGRDGAYDVQSVVTHEVGHFLGLDHANGPLSTMFPRIGAGSLAQRFIGRDERAGVATIYPPDGSRGAISGSVAHATGAPVAWAYVVALDGASGEVASGAVTDDSGAFTVEGLAAGSYLLYVEPLDGPIRPTDTVRLAKAPADASFSGTWFPSAVSVLAGRTTPGARCVVRDGPGPNPLDARGASLPAGVDVASVTLVGPGLDRVVAASVPGTGVSVTGLSHATSGNDPALLLSVSIAKDAPRGARSIELSDQTGARGFLTSGLLVHDPAPSIARVTPSSLRGGDLVEVDGAGFASPCDVVIGGVAATEVIVLDATRVTARAPASSRAGPFDVVVIRGDGIESRARAAVVYAGDPEPTAIDPSRGPLAGGTRHRVLGSGFVEPVQVTVGGAAAQVVAVRPDVVDFILPARASPGPVDVAVASGGLTGALAGGFVYVDAPPLVIDALDPTSGPTSGGTAIGVRGGGFEPGVRVTFDGLDATVGAVGSSSLIVLTPPHARGAVEVRAIAPSGLEAIAPASFSYLDGPAPAPPSSSHGGGCAIGGGDGAPAWLAVALVALSAAALRCRGARRV